MESYTIVNRIMEMSVCIEIVKRLFFTMHACKRSLNDEKKVKSWNIYRMEKSPPFSSLPSALHALFKRVQLYAIFNWQMHDFAIVTNYLLSFVVVVVAPIGGYHVLCIELVYLISSCYQATHRHNLTLTAWFYRMISIPHSLRMKRNHFYWPYDR